ncbi:hypothetical protein BH20ACT8_BH20ACT8_02900 [soil metagenome]
MNPVAEVVVDVAVIAGAVLCLLAGVGLLRFPDVFARMHAATKPSTLGLGLVLFALAFRAEEAGDVVKLLLVIALQFLTAPVGAHMIARAAHRDGAQTSPDTVLDELAADRPFNATSS